MPQYAPPNPYETRTLARQCGNFDVQYEDSQLDYDEIIEHQAEREKRFKAELSRGRTKMGSWI